MENNIKEHIEITPNICGGRARIAGHRIRVHDIVALHESLGQTPDEIVARYPQLTLSDVHAALAYFFDNRDTIRQQMKDDRDFAAALQQSAPSNLADRLAAKKAESDSVSS